MLTRAFLISAAQRQNVAAMTAPIRTHIREIFEAVGYAVVQFLFVRVGLCVRLTYAFGDDLCVTFFMTGIFAIFALHAC